MKTGGLTVLHDALSEAADKLTAFVVKYPNCHKSVLPSLFQLVDTHCFYINRRVICLTDGVDNGSKIRAHEITRRLQVCLLLYCNACFFASSQYTFSH